MHEREAQNAIVRRAVNEAVIEISSTRRVSQGTAKAAPAAPQAGAEVLRAGVQNLGVAVLGK